MLVEDVMQRNVITVTPGTTLPEALRLSAGRGVRHLPVLEGPELVGIVSDRDLKRAMASPATGLEPHELDCLLEKVTMDQIMTRAVITAGPMIPVEEAARLMVKERISALPVTERGRLVGIVTETDVLELFIRAIEDARAGISSIVTFPWGDGRKDIVIRVRTIDPGPAIGQLEARGYAVRRPGRG